MSEPVKKRPLWVYWVPVVLFVGFVQFVAWQLRNPAAREVESAMIGNCNSRARALMERDISEISC